jgi:uncharacterized membrane protein YagU involved in acid resistance
MRSSSVAHDQPLTRVGLKRESARRLRVWDRWLCRLPLISVTYLAKFSVPPFGAMGLALSIPLAFAVALFGTSAGRMVFDVRRTFAFVGAFAFIVCVQLLYIDEFSLPSLLLFFVIHLPYVFRLRRPKISSEQVLAYFQQLGLIVGICGLVQYGAQFVLGPTLAFPIENFVPEFLLTSKFNMQATLEYGSEIMRTNGVFMIEPSMFSQLTAVCILLELTSRRRLWYLAIMGVSILVSYSGTGLMLLAVCLLIDSIAKRRWGLLLGGLLAGAMVLALATFQSDGIFGQILKRSGEFSSGGSSGSMRFVGGFYMFDEFLWNEPVRAFLGMGAGSFAEYGLRATVPVAEMIMFKTVFEFGILGALAYWGFIGYCIATSTSVPAARIPILATIILGGLYTPFGHCLAFGVLLWPSRESHTGPVQLHPARA